MTKEEHDRLKKLWENDSNTYNAIFDFLSKKGLGDDDLIYIAELLNNYIQKSICS